MRRYLIWGRSGDGSIDRGVDGVWGLGSGWREWSNTCRIRSRLCRGEARLDDDAVDLGLGLGLELDGGDSEPPYIGLGLGDGEGRRWWWLWSCFVGRVER